MDELLTKQCEVIESLVMLNKKILELLAQHISVDEYEDMMDRILDGDDVII